MIPTSPYRLVSSALCKTYGKISRRDLGFPEIRDILIMNRQGRIQNFEGGGTKRKCGAKSAYEFRYMGHILRKICRCWSTFSAVCAPAGALSS